MHTAVCFVGWHSIWQSVNWLLCVSIGCRRPDALSCSKWWRVSMCEKGNCLETRHLLLSPNAFTKQTKIVFTRFLSFHHFIELSLIHCNKNKNKNYVTAFSSTNQSGNQTKLDWRRLSSLRGPSKTAILILWRCFYCARVFELKLDAKSSLSDP